MIDEDLKDESDAIPPRNNTPLPVTPLTKSQKRSAKKKTCKERQKLQLQTPSRLDKHVVLTFSTESPEYTPSKPSGSMMKLKQKEIDNILKNGNVIITGYCPQDQEQAQLLDLVVYDISAKWDNYTLLANLGRWDWTVNLGGIPVRWFPTSWGLSKRKQHEKFQAVVYNLSDDMTDTSLFPNGCLHQFLLDSDIKSFKIVKEVDGSRKMIDYFDT
ncbi:hypothetical protein RclHR1_08260004 [Rhizophagus clarus]|uniref:Uncharacterized protein n=1 Tax=Rhizophagus clarus TaxID=94130 RepID=A0A2Z6SMS4_9GLOM|nr:hypothetical protein RclHR1_08260004 [Rhizophagus clarus]